MDKPLILRHSSWDALFVALSFLHAAALFLVPSIPLIAVGVWWNSNTISHNFVHLPFFRSRPANRAYTFYLSALLAIPQSLWRERHLAHHAGQSRRIHWTSSMTLEATLILTVWGILFLIAPRLFLTVYLPGYALGLGLCYLHGHYEHAGGTTSHYGAIYNFSLFNDGYHVEHHARPGEHWRNLPDLAVRGSKTSRWPAVLRWMETVNLERLERLALRSKALQWFLLKTHGRALAELLPRLPSVKTVTVVGGGMFPRTALLLQRLAPGAAIRIVDANAGHIETAKEYLNGNITFEHGRWEPGRRDTSDLLVIPLSFNGDREQVYANPQAPTVLVHDWIWSKRGVSAIVSLFLLKRMNLIVR